MKLTLLHKSTGQNVFLLDYALDVAFVTLTTPSRGFVVPNTDLEPNPMDIFPETQGWMNWHCDPEWLD